MTQGSALGGLAGLSLLAGATPILVINNYLNKAGVLATVEYTVPAGRAAILTSMAIEQRGGVAYTRIGFMAVDGGSGSAGQIINTPPPGNFEPATWEGWVWLTATDTLQSLITGGDATSDYRVMLTGVEINA